MLIARTTKYREIIQVSTLLTLRRYQCVYMALRLYTEIQKRNADLIQVFKILNNIDLVDKEKLFTIAEYRQTRGHPFKLFKRRSRLNIRANSFSNRVVNSWNTLPENVVNAPSLNAFKSRLNKHWYWHPNKFEAKCYQVGSTDPNTRVETHRNAPEEV